MAQQWSHQRWEKGSRYYEVLLHQDLWGDWVLTRIWGRRGTHLGRTVHTPCVVDLRKRVNGLELALAEFTLRPETAGFLQGLHDVWNDESLWRRVRDIVLSHSLATLIRKRRGGGGPPESSGRGMQEEICCRTREACPTGTFTP